jgi:hypothetical protein
MSCGCGGACGGSGGCGGSSSPGGHVDFHVGGKSGDCGCGCGGSGACGGGRATGGSHSNVFGTPQSHQFKRRLLRGAVAACGASGLYDGPYGPDPEGLSYGTAPRFGAFGRGFGKFNLMDFESDGLGGLRGLGQGTVPAGTTILYTAQVEPPSYISSLTLSQLIATATTYITVQAAPALGSMAVTTNANAGSIFQALLGSAQFNLYVQAVTTIDRNSITDIQGDLDSVVSNSGLQLDASTICEVGQAGCGTITSNATASTGCGTGISFIDTLCAQLGQEIGLTGSGLLAVLAIGALGIYYLVSKK